MIDLPISPVLAWFLIGIAFYGIELAVPGFVIFFFGIGAWCTALGVYLLDLGLTSQLIVFLAASLLSLAALRSYLRSVFLGEQKEETDSVALNPAPSTGTVIETIDPPAEGKIRYAGTFWTAAADERIEKGQVVEIVDQEDLLVNVRPLNHEGEE